MALSVLYSTSPSPPPTVPPKRGRPKKRGRTSDCQSGSKKAKRSKNKDTSKNNTDIERPIPSPSPRCVKRAGPYLLGPRLFSASSISAVHCLARKEGTNKFYIIKMLTFGNPHLDRAAKLFLYTEHSILSLLQNQDGVVRCHDFFMDQALEEKDTFNENGYIEYTGRKLNRLCLVLDCLVHHDFSSKTSDVVTLKDYVIEANKLREKEAVIIFADIVRIVECLHKKNIIHQSLRLDNIAVNKKSKRVTIMNFNFSKHLVSENHLLTDRRQNPVYACPEMVIGKPYLGKPSDMWTLGVTLFMMVFGKVPFNRNPIEEFYDKITAARYTIPLDTQVSESTIGVIRDLLILDPKTRPTASQMLSSLATIIGQWRAKSGQNLPFQTVPDIDHEDPMIEWEPNKRWQVSPTDSCQQTPNLEEVQDLDDISDDFIDLSEFH